uniref:Anthranilate synthase component 2 n=1 Tax=Gloeochaete wittrockiana TaxID=38269 RepID=A0A3G1IVS3_9EUKA|nr:anthranilate synthase component II [Gloeochaete wittrockiana]ASQ40145.1 anthranilate synthase component II [Gloeochaete wittrockiana]
MILLLDNYDSFTYNLVQLFGKFKVKLQVIRNNKVSLLNIENSKPNFIVISPGPGHPDDSGICPKTIFTLAHKIPILGVCLGHQSIGQVFGGTISLTSPVLHAKTSKVFHIKVGIFNNITCPMIVARYHSLVIKPKSLPKCLKIIAWSSDGNIMACQHRYNKQLIGVQFHPESILTQDGEKIIKNFLYTLI